MNNQIARPKRYQELDAIRGIAALAVVFNHLLLVYGPRSVSGSTERSISKTYLILEISPLHLFWAGHEAVLLFFLLSGFVLALPYFRSEVMSYPRFITKRFFRLYVPYAGALFVAVAANWLFFGSVIGVSDWFSGTWQTAPDWGSILQHCIMLGHFTFARYNTAFWSLIYEARISCIYPLLLLWVRRMPTRTVLASSVILSVISQFMVLHFGMDDLWNTIHYSGLFILGIAVAKNKQKIWSYLEDRPRFLKALFWSSVAVLCCSQNLKHVPGVLHRMTYLTDWPQIMAVGSLLLCAMLFAPLKRMLQGSIPLYLGRISYSLYLVHGTILFVLVHLFVGRVWLLMIVYPISAIAAAIAFHFVVEKPSTEWSRHCGNGERVATQAAA